MSNKFAARAQKLEKRKKATLEALPLQPSKKSSRSRLKSVKINANTGQMLDILKMATSKTYVDLMEEALVNYLEVVALENVKVKAIQTLFQDHPVPYEYQTSIEEFMGVEDED
ncbi:hypothetical protein [Lactococcus petauri]|uniref:hypothetical protein n=1 Tax=Lactococcus petauri TaxID=1940789 RepID=UPI001F55E929|nr:hypothetical protein [Lactococcus petauri]